MAGTNNYSMQHTFQTFSMSTMKNKRGHPQKEVYLLFMECLMPTKPRIMQPKQITH